MDIFNLDLIEIEDTFSGRLDPYERLWVTVTFLCIKDLKAGNDPRGYAKSFLDPSNEYFQFASEALNLDPNYFKEKILKMLARADERAKKSGFAFL